MRRYWGAPSGLLLRPHAAHIDQARVFDSGHGPAERWGTRNIFQRLEQLEAAAKTVN